MEPNLLNETKDNTQEITPTTETKKHKKTRYFETYISKILKNISTDNGITSNAKQQLNSAICIVAKTLSEIATKLTAASGKKTLSEKEVESATKLLLSGIFLENALLKANNALEKFTENDLHGSRQNKAGILFPPSISEKFLRNFGCSKIMVTKNAPIYLAAILEHFVSNLLSQSVTELLKTGSRVRLTIRDLEITMQSDEDLLQLFLNCKMNFVGGGVVPKIHESLLNRKPRKKKKEVVELDANPTIETEPSTDLAQPSADLAQPSTTSFVSEKLPQPIEFVTKKHRFRPGTVSLREIRKFQKTSNCLTFAKFPFERFVRSVVNIHTENMKISKDVFIILQYYIEQFIVDFLRDSNSAAIHSGRVKLMATDLLFISALRKYPEINAEPFQTKRNLNDSILE